jgi:hypothetical protein
MIGSYNFNPQLNPTKAAAPLRSYSRRLGTGPVCCPSLIAVFLSVIQRRLNFGVPVLVVIAAALVNVALFVVVVAIYAWIEFSADIGSYSFLPRFWRAPDMGLTVAQIIAQKQAYAAQRSQWCRQPHTLPIRLRCHPAGRLLHTVGLRAPGQRCRRPNP